MTVARLLRSTRLHQQERQQRRCLAVYAMGEAWTSAFGTGVDDHQRILPGHEDEEEVVAGVDPPPLLVYDTKSKNEDVISAAVGWGHSAMIVQSLVSGRRDLLICGRPHEFSTLLRLRRLPSFVRNYAVKHALRHNVEENEGQGTSSFAEQVIGWMTGAEDGPEGPWSDATRYSIVPDWSPIKLASSEMEPAQVQASAGLTAVLSRDGDLFSFGLNQVGQCGSGKVSNNVWTPQPVMGLSSVFGDQGREKLEQEYPISQVALGLQHGLALNDQGHVYAWGKGERGNLGLEKLSGTSVAFAHRVKEFRIYRDGKRQVLESPKITHIAAGLNHSAAVTEENYVFVWGKNVATPVAAEDKRKSVVDAYVPIEIKGLPQDKRVISLSCGSHHTAMMLEDGSVWAVGISTDTTEPILEPIELIPPGIVDLPCRQFEAHFDRTTIVGKNGDQVLQVHLWSDEGLREHALFTPSWMEHFHGTRIRSVHRGWLHTLIVTEDSPSS